MSDTKDSDYSKAKEPGLGILYSVWLLSTEAYLEAERHVSISLRRKSSWWWYQVGVTKGEPGAQLASPKHAKLH